MSENCYKNNYINKVMAKIEFSDSSEVFDEENLRDVLAEIKERFPISEQSTAMKIESKIKLQSHGVETSSTNFPEWVFRGEDNTKSLKLNHMFVEVTLKKYLTYKDFENDFINPLAHLIKMKPNLQVRRTGIRFINIFNFPIEKYSDSINYFNKNISAQFENLDQVENFSRIFLINEYVIKDTKLRVQSGFFNPDYPALIKRKHFVLDLDAYMDFPHFLNEIPELFRNLHNNIETKFEELITDNLRDKLNE